MEKRSKKQHTVVEDNSFSEIKKQKKNFSKNKSLSNKAVTNHHYVGIKTTKFENLNISDTESPNEEFPTLRQATKDKSSKTDNLGKKGKYITNKLLISGKTDKIPNDGATETKNAIKKIKKKKINTIYAETLKDNISLVEKGLDSNIKNKKKQKQNLGYDKKAKTLDLQHEVLESSKNTDKKGKQNIGEDKMVFNEQCKTSNDASEKKTKIRKLKIEGEEVINDEVVSSESYKTSNNTCEKKTKKRKRKTVEEEVTNDNDIETVSSEQYKTSNDTCEKKKKKRQIVEEVINDKDIEISSSGQYEASKDTCEKKRKKRKRKIVEEEVINDEDIDRYCDELDEVHNKQYEDWVKLIEANLKSNKQF